MSFLKAFTQKSTIVITGGASGIGLALAKRLSKQGHEIIVAGRRAAQLEFAKTQVPELKTIEADISTDAGRIEFHNKVVTEYPQVNVLINNAGIVGSTALLKDVNTEEWAKIKAGIATNFEAPVHLSTLFLPHFISKPQALITNVTSGMAFFPTVYMPLYSATKAGLHSFTVSLRHQLKDTKVEVVEIAPPSVRTDINPDPNAADLDVFADDVFDQLLEAKNKEIGHGPMASLFRADRDTVDKWTEMSATWR